MTLFVSIYILYGRNFRVYQNVILDDVCLTEVASANQLQLFSRFVFIETACSPLVF